MLLESCPEFYCSDTHYFPTRKKHGPRILFRWIACDNIFYQRYLMMMMMMMMMDCWSVMMTMMNVIRRRWRRRRKGVGEERRRGGERLVILTMQVLRTALTSHKEYQNQFTHKPPAGRHSSQGRLVDYLWSTKSTFHIICLMCWCLWR